MVRIGAPWDDAVPSERALIGALLLTRGRPAGDRWPAIYQTLDPDMFADRLCRAAFAVIREVVAEWPEQPPIDPVAIAPDVDAWDPTANRTGKSTAQALMELQNDCSWVSSHAPRYAAHVAQAAARRQAHAIAAELADDMVDPAEDPWMALERVQSHLSSVPVPRGLRPAQAMTFDEFAASTTLTQDWIIPQLLGRRERLMVVAGEGTGKSTLLRQLGIAVAHGIHPFTGEAIADRNVLVVDAENTPEQIARKAAAQMEHARRLGGPMRHRERLRFLARQAGFDLGLRADRDLLIEEAMHAQAELVVIGPLYKLFTPSPSDPSDVAAKRVTQAIDTLISEVRCAVVIEHHAPFGEGRDRVMRPFGSTIWQRWPDTGIGLAADDQPGWYRVTRFREDRDARAWPRRLWRAPDDRGTAPWWTDEQIGPGGPAPTPERSRPVDEWEQLDAEMDWGQRRRDLR